MRLRSGLAAMLDNRTAHLILKDGTKCLIEPKVDGFVVGRHPKNHLVIDDASASRYHAKFFVIDGSYYLEDLDSRNGTFINLLRISKRSKIQNNDSIQFGQYECLFAFEVESESLDSCDSVLREPEKIDVALLARLKSGDKDAANEVIGVYFERVARAARRRLNQRRLRGSDSHDIAASVFESLWKKIDRQHFTEEHLTTSNEFWRLLCSMIRFKTEDHVRREHADKRGGGQVRGESVFVKLDDGATEGMAGQVDDGIAAVEVAALKDQYEKMMRLLPDPKIQELATLRIEEYSVAEIAEHFSKSDRWVKRKLAEIREIWSRTNGDSD